MRDREPEASRNTSGQHVVSRVLLRRFTAVTPHNAQGLVKISLLRPVYSSITGPNGSAKVRDFVPYASASLEAFWSTIETRFVDAFAALDNGSLFDETHADRLSVVRDVAALHFIRTLQFKRMHSAAFEASVAEQKEYWRTQPDMLLQYYRGQTGLIANGPGAVEHILDILFDKVTRQKMSGAMLREQIESSYKRIRSNLECYSVQVWTPIDVDDEFLIGDAPAVLFDQRSGLLGDVGSLELLEPSVALLMPLGPKHTACLHRGPSIGYQPAPSDVVERANAAQIMAAESNVFARPGTAFEQFADEVRHAGDTWQGFESTARLSSSAAHPSVPPG